MSNPTNMAVFFIVFGFAIPAFSGTPATKSKDTAAVPVLFVPGMQDDGSEYARREDIASLFRKKGFFLRVAHTTGHENVTTGASKLLSEACRIFPREKFHIVAKSLGGLWVREMITRFPFIRNHILSITTMATPHRGSKVADCLLSSNIYALISIFGDAGEQVRNLTSAYMGTVFNNKNNGTHGIDFFSVGYFADKANIRYAEFIRKFLSCSIEEPNDGVVTTNSAMWGEYLDTRPGEHVAVTDGYYPLGLSSTVDGKVIWPQSFSFVLDNLTRRSYGISFANDDCHLSTND